MFPSIKIFNKEIDALKHLKNDASLHPLVQGQIRQRVLSEVKASQSAPIRSLWRDSKHKIIQAIVSILASLGLLGGTAFASVSALPGDTLYPVKRAVEKVHVAATISAESKANLQSDIAETRLQELEQVRVQAKAHTDSGAATTAKAELEAQVQVSSALDALAEVKSKLEAKQDTKAAAAVSAHINKLEAKIQNDTTIKWTDDLKRKVRSRRSNRNPSRDGDDIRDTNNSEDNSKNRSNQDTPNPSSRDTNKGINLDGTLKDVLKGE